MKTIYLVFFWNHAKSILSVRLGPAFAFAFFCFFVFFFFSHVLGQILLLRLLFMHYTWTVATKFDLSNNFQPISAHRALFTDPQISLFSNFFFKNGPYGIIHTFKNYFATVFFSFQQYQNRPLYFEKVRKKIVILKSYT